MENKQCEHEIKNSEIAVRSAKGIWSAGSVLPGIAAAFLAVASLFLPWYTDEYFYGTRSFFATAMKEEGMWVMAAIALAGAAWIILFHLIRHPRFSILGILAVGGAGGIFGWAITYEDLGIDIGFVVFIIAMIICLAAAFMRKEDKVRIVSVPVMLVLVVAFATLFLPFLSLEISVEGFFAESISGHFFDVSSSESSLAFCMVVSMGIAFTASAVGNKIMMLAGEIAMLAMAVISGEVVEMMVMDLWEQMEITEEMLEALGLEIEKLASFKYGFWVFAAVMIVAIIVTAKKK